MRERLGRGLRSAVGSVAVGVAVAVFAAIGVASPASGDLYSGWYYQYATGPYYPSWFADDCVNAELTTGPPTPASNVAWSYSSIDPGRCGGTPAAMAPGWIGALAQGFVNGQYCGTTGWYFNATTASEFAVGQRICQSSGSYETAGWGTWWTLQNGTWQYSPAEFAWSPSNSF